MFGICIKDVENEQRSGCLEGYEQESNFLANEITFPELENVSFQDECLTQ